METNVVREPRIAGDGRDGAAPVRAPELEMSAASPPLGTPLITCRDLSKVYPLGKKRALAAVKGVNLDVVPGEFVILTGRSGSGKTTLLNLISGLTRPTAGEVRLGDAEIWRLPDAEQSRLRNQKIGFVFQFPSLMPTLTVLENVILPAIMETAEVKAEARGRAVKLLAEVGLSEKLASYPRQLSAGQQQRVVIARSLINRPDILLADEPTSNLDENTEHEIMALIQQIHRERGLTIMLVTHAKELTAYGSRALHMAAGELE